jgi:hypothetical protein
MAARVSPSLKIKKSENIRIIGPDSGWETHPDSSTGTQANVGKDLVRLSPSRPFDVVFVLGVIDVFRGSVHGDFWPAIRKA